MTLDARYFPQSRCFEGELAKCRQVKMRGPCEGEGDGRGYVLRWEGFNMLFEFQNKLLRSNICSAPLFAMELEGHEETRQANHSLYLPIYFQQDQLLIVTLMAYRATVNLRVFAGVAKPNPKMGQSLGPLGINMMKFCEEFNKVTTHIRGDVPLKVKLTAFTDRTFKFKIKPPQTSWFLKKAAGKDKFTPVPGHFLGVQIPIQYVYQIAKIKKELDPDLQKLDVATIMTMIMGQMHSVGGILIDEPVPAQPVHIKMKI